MNKHTSLTLTPEQRQQLQAIVRTGQHKARALTRVRITLLLDRSQEKRYTDKEIAEIIGCSPLTVANTRRRFLDANIPGVLAEKPMGPTAPVKMTGEIEAQLTLLACCDPPKGRARWTVRLLADRMVELGMVEDLSYVTVSRTLKKMKSNPGG
jgi:DNA-binding CsgD family transcriptional regulator